MGHVASTAAESSGKVQEREPETVQGKISDPEPRDEGTDPESQRDRRYGAGEEDSSGYKERF